MLAQTLAFRTSVNTEQSDLFVVFTAPTFSVLSHLPHFFSSSLPSLPGLPASSFSVVSNSYFDVIIVVAFYFCLYLIVSPERLQEMRERESEKERGATKAGVEPRTLQFTVLTPELCGRPSHRYFKTMLQFCTSERATNKQIHM